MSMQYLAMLEMMFRPAHKQIDELKNINIEREYNLIIKKQSNYSASMRERIMARHERLKEDA